MFSVCLFDHIFAYLLLLIPTAYVIMQQTQTLTMFRVSGCGLEVFFKDGCVKASIDRQYCKKMVHRSNHCCC